MPSDERYRDNLRRELEGAMQTPWFRGGKVVAALAKISQHKDADMIEDLIPLLWAKEDAVFFETVASVSLLLQQVPVGKLPDFDWPYWMGNSTLNGANIKRLKSSSA